MSDRRCPVCQARFRGAPVCSRCGADLEPLMRVVAAAYGLRKLAREELVAGHYDRAAQWANEAQGIEASETGARLARVSRALSVAQAALSSAPPSVL